MARKQQSKGKNGCVAAALIAAPIGGLRSGWLSPCCVEDEEESNLKALRLFANDAKPTTPKYVQPSDRIIAAEL